jgi:hypothetical protein
MVQAAREPAQWPDCSAVSADKMIRPHQGRLGGTPDMDRRITLESVLYQLDALDGRTIFIFPNQMYAVRMKSGSATA